MVILYLSAGGNNRKIKKKGKTMKASIKNTTNNFTAEYEIKETTTGSEKQKNWADNIKLNAFAEIMNVLGKGSNLMPTEEVYTENFKKYSEELEKLNNITDAKTFIDNRFRSASEWIKSVR